MSKEIIVYSKNPCPYCVRAKMLLQRKGLKFTEIQVNSDEVRQEMIEKSGGRMTVPQIFIDGNHIGGCDELIEFDREGKL